MFKDCRGRALKTLVYQTDFGFDFLYRFHLGMGRIQNEYGEIEYKVRWFAPKFQMGITEAVFWNEFGAKLRHVESLHCRKSHIFSPQKPYITLHLLRKNLCFLNTHFLTHFYIKNLWFLRHVIVVSLWQFASRGLLRRSRSVMRLYQTHFTDKAEIYIYCGFKMSMESEAVIA